MCASGFVSCVSLGTQPGVSSVWSGLACGLLTCPRWPLGVSSGVVDAVLWLQAAGFGEAQWQGPGALEKNHRGQKKYCICFLSPTPCFVHSLHPEDYFISVNKMVPYSLLMLGYYFSLFIYRLYTCIKQIYQFLCSLWYFNCCEI